MFCNELVKKFYRKDFLIETSDAGCRIRNVLIMPTHGLPVSARFTKWLGTWTVFVGDTI